MYLSVIERTFSWREVALREPHRHHSHLFKLGAHEPKIDRKAVAIGKQCIVGKRKIKPAKWETICSIGLDRTRLPGQKRPNTYSDPDSSNPGAPQSFAACSSRRAISIARSLRTR